MHGLIKQTLDNMAMIMNLGGDGRKIAVSGRREYKRRRWEFIFTLAIASSRT